MQSDKLRTLFKIPLMHLHHLACVVVTHTVPGVQYPSSIAAHRQVTTINDFTQNSLQYTLYDSTR